jgi:aspartate dehydrogenase
MSKEHSKKHLKIGIVGCGAIGSRLAEAIAGEFKDKARLSALYDNVPEKSYKLANTLKLKNIVALSLEALVKNSKLVIEAASVKVAKEVARLAVSSGRDVLIMSTGGLFEAEDVFRQAEDNGCNIYLPSGAIGGIDVVKAASLAKIKKLVLTTKKPPRSFIGVQYILKSNIQLDKIKQETLLYEGDVKTAIRLFPKNVNVSSTLALASQFKDKMLIRIVTSPEYKHNTHEILLEGEFGRLTLITENLPCPDNFKTSYLAVLSAIATLRQILRSVKIGT